MVFTNSEFIVTKHPSMSRHLMDLVKRWLGLIYLFLFISTSSNGGLPYILYLLQLTNAYWCFRVRSCVEKELFTAIWTQPDKQGRTELDTLTHTYPDQQWCEH